MEQQTDPGRSAGSGAKWIQGAAVLGIAAVISKLLGTLQKIPLQNVAGDGAYGIYTLVYPFYVLILFLATAGFPVAVSAFVSQRLTRGDRANAVRVLRVAVVLLSLSGAAGFVLLLYGADTIAGWIGNRETAPAIRSVSYALLFVPIMSALRGYFQGSQDMVPTAVSQVVEQFVRVGTLIVVLLVMTARFMEDRHVAAGATFGAATGAFAGMAVMLAYWARHSRLAAAPPVASTSLTKPEPYLQLAARMLRYAIPICLGAIAVPVMNIVDSFTLPRLFREPEMSDEQVMAMVGVYARGLPLVQMAAMLVGSIAVALVPAIAEAKAQHNPGSVRVRTELSMRLTWITGAAASVGLAVTALPVNHMLYGDNQGTAAIAIVAFTAVFSTMIITTSSVLQGIGASALPAVNMLIAAAVKIGLNFALVPFFGMNGAALAGVIAFGLAALLNVAAIRKTTGTPLRFSVYILKTGGALAVMAAIAAAWTHGLPMVLAEVIPAGRALYTLTALTGIALGAAVYTAAVLRLRAVTAHELQIVPGMEKKLLPLLRKLRLIS